MAKSKPAPKSDKAEPQATHTTPAAPDGLPTVTAREAAEIAGVSVISTADVDAAGALWAKHAGPEWAGLWVAGVE